MSQVKILVVDDESRMRKLVKDFLYKSGYEVLEAANGEEAIDIFVETKDVSLVILDGNGIITSGEEKISFQAGDSIFIAAGRKAVHIEGTCELITTRI